MRVFGVILWPEILSDEEYVARIRKGLRISRWFRWLKAATGLGFLALAFVGATMFVRLLAISTQDLDEHEFVFLAFGLAIALGGILGLWLFQAAYAIGTAFFGHRRDKLLVECWDALHKNTRK